MTYWMCPRCGKTNQDYPERCSCGWDARETRLAIGFADNAPPEDSIATAMQGERMKLEENAKLTKLKLGNEDHGIYSYCLMFDMGGTSQGTGSYCLWTPEYEPETDNTGKLIRGLLKVFEVDDISKIEGKYCRIKRYKEEWSSPIEEVGNILKDTWMNVRTLEVTSGEEKVWLRR